MEKNSSLKSFLIKRFLIIMGCTAFAEALINRVYYDYVFPILRDLVGSEDLFVSKGFWGALTDIVVVIIRVLFYALAERLFGRFIPFLAMLARKYIASQDSMSIINAGEKYSGIAGNLFVAGVFIIIVALLLVALLPYIIAVLVFIRMILAKIDKPVKTITGGMQRLTTGDLSVRLDFDTEHEFVDMRDAFNVMAEEMEDSAHKKAEYEHAKNLLFADIAHDLKTPITTISGYSKALADGMVTDEAKKQEYLNSINMKSQRMDELINLLFEYAKLSSDSFTLKKEKCDVAELFREILAGMYMDFEEKGFNLEINIDDGRAECMIDRLQISRAITNLLNNAMKHNNRGAEILASLRNLEDNIVITVADNGTVIDDEVAAHIFEPFVVGDESRNSRGGSGLGLSISSKIVTMHGGTLELINYDEGQYTKGFVLTLQKL